MNIYRFELKKSISSLIVWAVVCVCILSLFMLLFYPMFIDSQELMEQLFEPFPTQVLTAMGLNLDTVFTFEGFYSFVYTYTALVLAIMAVSVTVGIFAREKRSRCADFLLSRPVSRKRIFGSKLLASLTCCALCWLVYSVALTVYAVILQDGFAFDLTFVLTLIAPLLTQFVFVGMSAMYALLTRRVRFVSGVATVFGVGAFVLSSLVELLGKEPLRALSPIKYFDVSFVYSHGYYDWTWLCAVGVVALSLGIGFLTFIKRDSRAD